MTNRISIYAVLCALITAPAMADDITQTPELSGFDRIDISGVYELDVTVGDGFSISLTGEEEMMARVSASVRNGTLYLSREKKKKRWSRNEDDAVRAVITMPTLLSLDVSGVVDGDISGIDSERFDLDLSGVGDVELSGECGVFDADVSGVGDLDARDLECRSVEVEVSGVGSATVFASEEVDARVSGMGDIDVYGSPKEVRKDSSLFAEITVH